jgi:uncharacterized protein
MIRRLPNVLVPVVAVVAVTTLTLAAQETGIKNKRPVFAGACKVCPWGAVGETVKGALKNYGYDVLICSSCAQSEGPRLVAGARMPSPPNPATEAALQNLWRAYEGKGAYATEGPRRNLRLLATIQAPNYLIVAVKSEFGVTDLSQLKAKRWPLRILVGNEGQEVLNYYGLTRQAIESAGGHVGSSTNVAERANFDAVVAGGSLGNAPEFNVWYEVSQKYNLTYLQLSDALLDKLAQDNDMQRGSIPNGLLRGIDHPIPTVVRTGHVVFGRDDMPDDFAYLVARALDEHQDLLLWSHLNFSYNLHTVWKALDVPLHPGAAQYY